MKKLTAILTVLATLAAFAAPQSAQAFDKAHHISLSWGSYNLEYFVPRSELQYLTPQLFGLDAAVRLKFRSVGSMMLLPVGAYDILLTGEYSFDLPVSNFAVQLGAGAGLWLDVAYKTFSSFQPAVSASFVYDYYRYRAELPVVVRFYADGFDANFRLQGSFRPFDRMSVTMWIEMSLVTFYDFHYTEARPGCFVGLEYFIGN